MSDALPKHVEQDVEAVRRCLRAGMTLTILPVAVAEAHSDEPRADLAEFQLLEHAFEVSDHPGPQDGGRIGSPRQMSRRATGPCAEGAGVQRQDGLVIVGERARGRRGEEGSLNFADTRSGYCESDRVSTIATRRRGTDITPAWSFRNTNVAGQSRVGYIDLMKILSAATLVLTLAGVMHAAEPSQYAPRAREVTEHIQVARRFVSWRIQKRVSLP
jgi:hypothetical protein